jgi:hypothetical protein
MSSNGGWYKLFGHCFSNYFFVECGDITQSWECSSSMVDHELILNITKNRSKYEHLHSSLQGMALSLGDKINLSQKKTSL